MGNTLIDAPRTGIASRKVLGSSYGCFVLSVGFMLQQILA